MGVWWEVGHRWDYTIACSFLSPLHAPLFLSMRCLQKRGPSVPGFLFNSAFMGCLLSACSMCSCVMVQGALGCWGRLSSLLMVWDPGGFTLSPSPGSFLCFRYSSSVFLQHISITFASSVL